MNTTTDTNADFEQFAFEFEIATQKTSLFERFLNFLVPTAYADLVERHHSPSTCKR